MEASHLIDSAFAFTTHRRISGRQFVRFYWKQGAGSDGAGRKAKILRQVTTSPATAGVVDDHVGDISVT